MEILVIINNGKRDTGGKRCNALHCKPSRVHLLAMKIFKFRVKKREEERKKKPAAKNKNLGTKLGEWEELELCNVDSWSAMDRHSILIFFVHSFFSDSLKNS